MVSGFGSSALWSLRGIPSAHARHALEVREEFGRILLEHVSDAYRRHLSGQDASRPFLNGDRLQWERWRENQLHLPRSVFDSYTFYLAAIHDRDLGSVRVYRKRCHGRPVYALQVTTDGDSGWLELYDENGLLLGAGRTYLELIAWDRLDAVRGQVQSMELPPALRDAPSRTLWGKRPRD